MAENALFPLELASFFSLASPNSYLSFFGKWGKDANYDMGCDKSADSAQREGGGEGVALAGERGPEEFFHFSPHISPFESPSMENPLLIN